VAVQVQGLCSAYTLSSVEFASLVTPGAVRMTIE
jgi:hypothetical protein